MPAPNDEKVTYPRVVSTWLDDGEMHRASLDNNGFGAVEQYREPTKLHDEFAIRALVRRVRALEDSLALRTSELEEARRERDADMSGQRCHACGVPFHDEVGDFVYLCAAHIPERASKQPAPSPSAAVAEGAGTLARRVHNAWSAYRSIVYDELEPAIMRIVGDDRLEDANVEHDSQVDNSVEIVLSNGERLTESERAAIKALGFDRVWNDERSGSGRPPRSSRLGAAARPDRETVAAALFKARYPEGLYHFKTETDSIRATWLRVADAALALIPPVRTDGADACRPTRHGLAAVIANTRAARWGNGCSIDEQNLRLADAVLQAFPAPASAEARRDKEALDRIAERFIQFQNDGGVPWSAFTRDMNEILRSTNRLRAEREA